MTNDTPKVGLVMRGLSQYISQALGQNLPNYVSEKAKQHVLDTLASMVSGAHMAPGKAAVKYARLQGGTPEATVAGSNLVTNAVNAALANGMAAHADETDDSHFLSRSHLGCAVVPAALAMSEKEGRSGLDMLKAVALGYDIGGRLTPALNMNRFFEAGHSTHTFAPLFGAAAAASTLAGLTVDQTRWMISYTAQQASGVNCWQRDIDHIEKAFDFGGMAARNGVSSATMVQAGWTGLDDVFSGPRNFFFAFAPNDAQPELLLDGLGERYEITLTNIKKWTVGSPIQSVLDSVQALILENDLAPKDIAEVVIRMSDKEYHVVDNRHIADINCQHMTAVMIIDRTVTFESAHDEKRMNDKDILLQKAKVKLTPDPSLSRRQPIIELKTMDGRNLTHRTIAVRGTPDNPMTSQEVKNKAFELFSGPLGSNKAANLIECVWNIEDISNVRDLRPLLVP